MPLKRGIKVRSTELLKTTTAARALNYGDYDPESEWNKCSGVISESLERCSVGSWVFFQSNADAVSAACDTLARYYI